MKNSGKSIQIAEEIYWVGSKDQVTGLHCNPYLLIDGDEAVFIDPGSMYDFETVYKNVSELVPIKNIKYVILHHQDPDFCSSVPLFEKKELNAEIITFWRTQVFLKYYGIKSKYYLVNENDYKLELKSGRILKFLHTPYLHFPGAIMTYDTKTKVLFSSDVFGAYSRNWELYAGEKYIEAMKVFHENYMPSNDILGPVMEMLLTMDISCIAPQHGSIIAQDIKKYIKVLRDLECGAFLIPLKKELGKTGGYLGTCNQILKRYYAVFDQKEVMDIFKDSHIELDPETGLIVDFNSTGKELWNNIFEIIFSKKGFEWISIVDTLVNRITKEYEIEFPAVFESEIFNIKKASEELSAENIKIKEINVRLKTNLKLTQDKLIKSPVTGLFNELFFTDYFSNEIQNHLRKKENCALLIVDIDNLAKLSFNFGASVEIETLKGMAYLLKDKKEEHHMVFKLEGPTYAYYIPNCENKDSVNTAEFIRNLVSRSEIFVEPITVSVGVANLNEFFSGDNDEKSVPSALFNVAKQRVTIAKKRGMNAVCSTSSISDYTEEVGKILIADTDLFHLETLEVVFSQAGFKVLTCTDGECELDMIEKENPDVIISEILLPKIDGFSVREKMLTSTSMKDIPFILVSHKKDEDSIQRSFSMNIEHYFKKPYTLYELVGLVKNKIKFSVK